jgi:hypothetical protein
MKLYSCQLFYLKSFWLLKMQILQTNLDGKSTKIKVVELQKL